MSNTSFTVCPVCREEGFQPGKPCPNCQLRSELADAYLQGRALTVRRGEGSLGAWWTRIYRMICQRGGGEL